LEGADFILLVLIGAVEGGEIEIRRCQTHVWIIMRGTEEICGEMVSAVGRNRG
jgi:hypothetical protein